MPSISDIVSSTPLNIIVLSLPNFPIKYPASNITFCLALVFKGEFESLNLPSSSGVNNIIAQAISVLFFSIFSITVCPLFTCSCSIIGSNPCS